MFPLWTDDLKKRDGRPAYVLSDMLLLRSNLEIFTYVADTFYKAIKGKTDYNKLTKVDLMSDVVTASDEAFVFLTLENNFDRWIKQYEIDQLPNKDEVRNEVFGPYTRTGVGNKGFTRRTSGWSTEGINRYNALCAHIDANRTNDKNRTKENSSEYQFRAARCVKSPVTKTKEPPVQDQPPRPVARFYLDDFTDDDESPVKKAPIKRKVGRKKADDSEESEAEDASGNDNDNESVEDDIYDEDE